MKKCLLACLPLLFVYYLFAQESIIYTVTSGKIVFQSDAPNEMINASSENLVGLLDVSKKTFAFKVFIRSFQGFNSPLQKEHFNENYLESNKYTDATFTGKIIEDVNLAQNGSYSVRAKGNLLIHGIKQERIIKSDIVVKDGKLFIKTSFQVSLSDHDIPIPKVVKDKLATLINVDISCLLEPR